MKIGVDLDGPVYQFERCVWQWKHRDLVANGEELPPLPSTKTWNFFEEPGWDMKLEDYILMVNEGCEAGYIFNSLPPHPGSVEGIKTLRERGHSIHIMTYRITSPGSISNTEAFLRKYDIPFDTLSFTKDKTLIPVDIMIEDNVRNAESLTDAGVIAVIVDRPWNQSWDGYRVGDFNGPREQDWEQFVDLVDLFNDTTEYLYVGKSA